MANPIEKWRSKRISRQAKGTITFGTSVCPCLVLDTSLSGARIRIDLKDRIPTNFCLFIEEDRMRADCEIVWRNGQELGVRISSFRHSQQTHV